MKYILDRLKEKTTWAQLFTVLGAFGLSIPVVEVQALSALGMAIATAVGVFTKETKEVEK